MNEATVKIPLPAGLRTWSSCYGVGLAVSRERAARNGYCDARSGIASFTDASLSLNGASVSCKRNYVFRCLPENFLFAVPEDNRVRSIQAEACNTHVSDLFITDDPFVDDAFVSIGLTAASRCLPGGVLSSSPALYRGRRGKTFICSAPDPHFHLSFVSTRVKRCFLVSTGRHSYFLSCSKKQQADITASGLSFHSKQNSGFPVSTGRLLLFYNRLPVSSIPVPYRHPSPQQYIAMFKIRNRSSAQRRVIDSLRPLSAAQLRVLLLLLHYLKMKNQYTNTRSL